MRTFAALAANDDLPPGARFDAPPNDPNDLYVLLTVCDNAENVG